MKEPTSVVKSATDALGGIGEIAVASHFARAGYFVSKPLAEQAPYDLIVDDGKALHRIQVKTTKPKRGALCVPISRVNRKHVDYVACYDAENDETYVVSVADIKAKTYHYIRVGTAKNNQSKGVNRLVPLLKALAGKRGPPSW